MEIQLHSLKLVEVLYGNTELIHLKSVELAIVNKTFYTDDKLFW